MATRTSKIPELKLPPMDGPLTCLDGLSCQVCEASAKWIAGDHTRVIGFVLGYRRPPLMTPLDTLPLTARTVLPGGNHHSSRFDLHQSFNRALQRAIEGLMIVEAVYFAGVLPRVVRVEGLDGTYQFVQPLLIVTEQRHGERRGYSSIYNEDTGQFADWETASEMVQSAAFDIVDMARPESPLTV